MCLVFILLIMIRLIVWLLPARLTVSARPTKLDDTLPQMAHICDLFDVPGFAVGLFSYHI